MFRILLLSFLPPCIDFLSLSLSQTLKYPNSLFINFDQNLLFELPFCNLWTQMLNLYVCVSPSLLCKKRSFHFEFINQFDLWFVYSENILASFWFIRRKKGFVKFVYNKSCDLQYDKSLIQRTFGRRSRSFAKK
jgi:hypothetical protein